MLTVFEKVTNIQKINNQKNTKEKNPEHLKKNNICNIDMYQKINFVLHWSS